MLILSWMIIPIIIVALVCVNLFLAQKKNVQSKLSIYECGFSPKFSARLPFSLRFFLLALLFLIFDIELVLILIFPMALISSPFFLSMIFFCLFLLLGLFHEWNEGSLSWVN